MFEEDLEAKDREMYDLKHDLINGQVELERAKKEAEENARQVQTLRDKIAELEKELEELLN